VYMYSLFVNNVYVSLSRLWESILKLRLISRHNRRVDGRAISGAKYV
jgi:hypothetical protein